MKIHLQLHETLKKLQENYYNAHHDQQIIEKTFKVGNKVWFHLNKEMLQSLGNKIKVLWYGHFYVLEKVGDNSYKLNLSHICTFT